MNDGVLKKQPKVLIGRLCSFGLDRREGLPNIGVAGKAS